MILIEVKADLFNYSDKYFLAHCISADFGMGRGIVVKFNQKFNLKNRLVSQYGNVVTSFDKEQGLCILEGTVLNLVTKCHYWDKPTYQSMEKALLQMKNVILQNNIKRVAMPLIGCGLDKLNWDRVRVLLLNIFDDLEGLEIVVCRL